MRSHLPDGEEITVSASEETPLPGSPNDGAETPRPGPLSTAKRATLACTRCRKGKARCVIRPNSNRCEECLRKNKECSWVQSNRGKWSRAVQRSKARAAPNGQSTTLTAALPHMEGRDDGEAARPNTLHQAAQAVAARELRSPQDSAGTGVSNETQASENSVVHVHNPGHFRVDDALFPLGVLAHAQRQLAPSNALPGTQTPVEGRNDSSSSWGPASLEVGIANDRYFNDDINHHLLPRTSPPPRASILVDQIITTAQAEQLFKIFFERMNPQIGLLDERLYSPQSCHQRSPFLFMTICAVAAKFYKNDLLYHILLQHARKAGMDAMLTSKSTATVQGFLILATWMQQSVSYKACNSYFFAGIAIRIGVEIGLHRKTVLRYPDNMEPTIKQIYTREILERERTWLCVFILDRALSAMTGKPPQAPETYLIRNIDKWWRQPECLLSDVYISALSQLLRILYRCIDVIYSTDSAIGSVSTGHNYQIVIKDLQWRLQEWGEVWTENLNEFHRSPINKGAGANLVGFYISSLQFQRSFYSLVPLSFGLQQYTHDSFDGADQLSFVAQCYRCARSTLEIATNELRHWEQFKAMPDPCIVSIGYAACFLLKLEGPEFRHHAGSSAQTIELIQATATMLEETSEDQRHIHHAYALFLKRHLSLRCTQSFQATSAEATALGAVGAEQQRAQQQLQQEQSHHHQLLPSFLPVTDLHSDHINIDLDGSLNFQSESGVNVFCPGEDLVSGWMDSVLGLQNRRDDPFSTFSQFMPPTAGHFEI